MKKLVFALLLLCCANLVIASHIRSGYITVHRVDCGGSLEYHITVIVFTNTQTEVKFSNMGMLYFGDGQSFQIPVVDNVLRPDIGPNVGMGQYTKVHTYAANGSYVIGYVEPNRNGGIRNMADSFNETFYIETRIDTRSCFEATVITPTVFSGLAGSELNMALGISSNEDTQVTYELTVPLADRSRQVNGYTFPAGLTLNYVTGILNWNTATITAGEYNFAVTAVQWMKIDDQWRIVGSTRIDFQVILTGNLPAFSMTDNQTLDDYNRLLVIPGEEKKIRVFYEAEDSSGDPSLEMFSSLPSGATFTTYDSVSETNGNDIKVGLLTIAPDEQEVRSHPYLITVRGKHLPHSSFQVASDITYVVYTDEILPLPVTTITGTESEIATVSVFPNPTQDHAKINVDRGGISEAHLYSLQGKLILQKTFEGSTELMLSHLPVGVYVVDVRRNNASIKRMKLVKSN